MLKTQLDADIKTALLAGDKQKVLTLRGLKSAILYEEVAKGAREEGLDDNGVQAVLRRESKKRVESIELYKQAKEQERAAKEQAEKDLIDSYLPAQMSEEELSGVVARVISELGVTSMQDMGKVIGAVKASTNGSADGALTAKLVKEALSKS